MKNYLTICLFVCLCVKGITCFQCYMCSTMVNGDACRSLKKGAYTQSCQGGACLTRHNFDGSVQRDCGVSSYGNTCQNIAGAKVCYCTSEKCNGEGKSYGIKNRPFTVTVILLSIVVYFIKE